MTTDAEKWAQAVPLIERLRGRGPFYREQGLETTADLADALVALLPPEFSDEDCERFAAIARSTAGSDITGGRIILSDLFAAGFRELRPDGTIRWKGPE